MNEFEKYEIVEKPGFLGFRKADTYKIWNDMYGENNWLIAYSWNAEVISRRDALGIYEDAYFHHFEENPDQLESLINNWSEVCDTEEANVLDGINYETQNGPCNHIHDIAVRRVVKLRHGENFKGKEVMQIRGPQTPGYLLGPGKVKFHLPNLIEDSSSLTNYGLDDKWEEATGSRDPWWEKQSVEEFYQNNKLLMVRK